MKNVDLAWAAGVIDGEACIGAYKHHSSHNLKVEVNSVDPRICEKLHTLFGGSLSYKGRQGGVRRPNERRLFTWTCSGHIAGRVLRAVRPYLVIKGEQADIGLQIAATMQLRPEARRHYTTALPDSVKELRAGLAQQLKDLKTIEYDAWTTDFT